MQFEKKGIKRKVFFPPIITLTYSAQERKKASELGIMRSKYRAHNSESFLKLGWGDMSVVLGTDDSFPFGK